MCLQFLLALNLVLVHHRSHSASCITCKWINTQQMGKGISRQVHNLTQVNPQKTSQEPIMQHSLQENWALLAAKILCHLPKKGQSANILFADCPTILAGGKERQVAKKSWWQRWRATNGAHLRPLCHLPSH